MRQLEPLRTYKMAAAAFHLLTIASLSNASGSNNGSLSEADSLGRCSKTKPMRALPFSAGARRF